MSAVLPLPGGGLILAGRFTRVGETPAYRLARLTPAIEVETMSLLPDGGILVSRLLRTLPPPEGARRLVRIGPDSDMKLLDPRIVGGISRSV